MFSRSFATSAMECVRASGRTMVNVQTGSSWGRAYGKDACSHHCCSYVLFTAVLRVVKGMVFVKVEG